MNSGPSIIELARLALLDVEGGYDLLSVKFDHSRYVTPAPIIEKFFEHLQNSVNPPAKAIDLACGTGVATRPLALFTTEHVTAYDLSNGMLRTCRRNLKEKTLKAEVEYINGDLLQLPYQGVFDLAISFGAFGHIPAKDEVNFIQNVHRALKPGGYFAFITTGKYPMWSMSLWVQRAFNVLISLRNLLIRPPFIMYYLTFRLPGIKQKLEASGFQVEIIDPFFKEKGIADLVPFRYYQMVVARKMSPDLIMKKKGCPNSGSPHSFT